LLGEDIVSAIAKRHVVPNLNVFLLSQKVLQEGVLRFVNLVGHIVHSNTVHFGGSPNKNIGDAFLLVWKASLSMQDVSLTPAARFSLFANNFVY